MSVILKHPDYNTLPVIVAKSKTDKAQAGKFFVTYQGKYLSHIAQDAYGSGTISHISIINRSEYNKQNCIYRQSSSSCSSPTVPGSSVPDNLSWSSKAWLSLCNVDRNGSSGGGLGEALGTSYQVIWIPPADGREPWDIEPPVDPFKPIHIDPIPVPPPPIIDPIIIDPIDPDEPEPEPEPAPKKAGLPWWLAAIMGLGALTTVIYFAAKDKKKKKGKK